ncbi:hypothetical protein [uncultured Aquimarina sp.]|uniref:hypothetical protein n=1 Tax=uncultured Aquimarina sp. TaxID=575652 RepID=UPI002614A0C2|nr:hypothetical protein [uncultured Aquimarina sp.]
MDAQNNQENNDLKLYTYHYKDHILDNGKIKEKETKDILSSTSWVITENNNVFLFDTSEEATTFTEKANSVNTQKGRTRGSISFSNINGFVGGRLLNFSNVTKANIPSSFDGTLRSFRFLSSSTSATAKVRFYNNLNLSGLIQVSRPSLFLITQQVNSNTSSFEFRE